MKIGHIYLATSADDAFERFASLIEALDRLAIQQTVLVASNSLARRLDCCPYVTVGSIVRTPVTAYCLMPKVDVAHIHDDKSGQAGLLLTLTRSTPYVMTMPGVSDKSRNPLKRSVYQRAQSLILPADMEPEKLIHIYRRTIDEWSRLQQGADCG